MTSIGTDVARVDGPEKVTGRARYSADRVLPDMAYAYVVLSTIGKGRIRAMNTDAAAGAPGVLRVYTPFQPLKLYPPSPPGYGENYAVLQDRDVRFRGQAIGLVVARTFEQAREAAALVTTDYDAEQPDTSLAAGSPGVTVPDLGQGGPPAKLAVLAPGVTSIDQALAASAVTVQGTYTQGSQHHVAMEPHATVAVWQDGRLTAYCGSQMPQLHALSLAAQLGVEPGRVRILSPYVGGAFGSRVTTWPDMALAAAAARDLGRPVKLVVTREQVFTMVGHRPALSQTIRLGASADGVLNAVSHEADVAMPAVGGWITVPAQDTSAVLYKTPNLAVDQRLVGLDIPPTWAMRAPNESPGGFAIETAMDELAVSLRMDPLRLRLRNYATTAAGTGRPWSSKHLRECYETGAERFGWSSRPRPGTADGQWLVGTGMATAIYPASRYPAGVRVRFRDDGTVVVASATSDIGTGAFTLLSICGSDALGIPLSRIEPQLGDSALPQGAPAVGSAGAGSTAPAVKAAAQAAITALVDLAVTHSLSPFHGMNADRVHYQDGYLDAGSGRSVGFARLLKMTGTAGVEATADAGPGPEAGQYSFHSFGAHFCEVRVNRLTGEPRVSRFTTVVDIGTVVNAKTARSQIVGSVIFGIGHALLEVNPLEDSGRLAASSLGDYLVPVNADIPDIDVHWLDYPDTVYSPFGARGVGELASVGAAAAVGNAIHDATGIRVRDLPITLDKLLG